MDANRYRDLVDALREAIADLDALSEEPLVGGRISQFGGLDKLEEGLADELREVCNVAGDLLDRARDCPEESWPDTREELVEELDRAFGGVRESFAILYHELADSPAPPLDPITDRLQDRLRSAENQLYWANRADDRAQGDS
jgi:hypothetical protein